MLLMGVFELVGVASVLPFLSVLANPSAIETRPVFAMIAVVLGLTSPQQFLMVLGGFTVAMVLIGATVKSVTIYAFSRFSRMREYTIASRLLGTYLNQPYVWFLNRHSGDLGKTILSEVAAATNGVMLPAMRLLAFGIITLMLVVLLFVVNPLAALGGLFIIGGGYLLSFAVTRRYLGNIGAARVRANQARFEAAQEAFGGFKDVKLHALERHYLQRFAAPARRYAHYQAASQVIGEIPRHLLEALLFGAMMIFLLGLLSTAADRATFENILPTLGVFAFAGARIFPAVQNVYRSVSQMRFNRAALDTLHADFCDHQPATTASAPAVGADMSLGHRVTFDDVHYTYPAAPQPALRGLSLEIRANTTVGIVGASGAGKTTAVDVLLGLLTPERGAIAVDGVPVERTNLRAWQQRLGYVPQHIFLTDDSIAANIAMGRAPGDIDMAAVERTSRIAELHRFVEKELPGGYLTQVGERGVRLSGGQRQRIGIARALYHDPDVLILDEATSALDNLTERAVMDAVHNLAHAKTIILIAHRLSTVRNCDTIFVLEHGRCTAADTFDALVERHGTFRQLAQATG